jgi:hypothetical protein
MGESSAMIATGVYSRRQARPPASGGDMEEYGLEPHFYHLTRRYPMNRPIASRIGVEIVMTTFIPINGIKPGMFSVFCRTPW